VGENVRKEENKTLVGSKLTTDLVAAVDANALDAKVYDDPGESFNLKSTIVLTTTALSSVPRGPRWTGVGLRRRIR